MNAIRIAGMVNDSIVDGPGVRLALFTQGCPHRCPGCHNPETHDFAGGTEVAAEEILAAFDRNPLLKGISLTGGEPISQAGVLLPVVRGIRQRGRDIVIFTGWRFEQLLEMRQTDPALAELLSLAALLIDGPYLEAERDLTLRFRGSRNQRVLDLPRSLAAGKAVEMEEEKDCGYECVQAPMSTAI